MTRIQGLRGYLGYMASITSPYTIATIGNNVEFTPKDTAENVEVPGLGNNYMQGVEIGRVRPEFELTYHPQDETYLNDYLITQTGNSLTEHYLSYLSTSSEYGVLWKCKPSTVTVNIELNRPVSVRAVLMGQNYTSGTQTSAGSYTVTSSDVAMNTDVFHVKILDPTGAAPGTVIRDFTSMFRRASFTVDYKTQQIFTGVSVTPSDVLEGVKTVSGTMELSVNESASLKPYVSNTSYLTVQIGVASPWSSVYTFYSSIVRMVSVTVPGVDVQRQSLEWQCKWVNRSNP